MLKIDVKNYWKDEDRLFLLDHEEVCPDCKGHGIIGALSAEEVFLFDTKQFEIVENGNTSPDAMALIFCNLCGGEGKVDWIRRIRGTEFHEFQLSP